MPRPARRFDLVARDMPPDGFEEDAAGGRPASFIAVAGAYLFALGEARRRGLIDR